jgi:hypothetical protein
LGCLVVGAGLERVRQALTVPEIAPDPRLEERARFTPTVRTIIVTNSAAERAANEVLRRRVAELEKALAAREAARVQEPKTPTEEKREERPPRQFFTERMEQLKKEKPEEYAELQKRFEERRQSREQQKQDQAEFMAAVDTKNMTDMQKENHAKLVETVARLNELSAQMHQPGVERTPEMNQEMHEARSSLGELFVQERRFLLEETGRAIGYQGTQAGEFADQMQVIIDNTTMPGFDWHGFGDRGGRSGVAPAAAPAAVGR